MRPGPGSGCCVGFIVSVEGELGVESLVSWRGDIVLVVVVDCCPVLQQV